MSAAHYRQAAGLIGLLLALAVLAHLLHRQGLICCDVATIWWPVLILGTGIALWAWYRARQKP